MTQWSPLGRGATYEKKKPLTSGTLEFLVIDFLSRATKQDREDTHKNDGTPRLKSLKLHVGNTCHAQDSTISFAYRIVARERKGHHRIACIADILVMPNRRISVFQVFVAQPTAIKNRVCPAVQWRAAELREGRSIRVRPSVRRE